MAKFNVSSAKVGLTENLAGGQAFTESPELEFISILLTSFVEDQYYRSAEKTLEQLVKLIDTCSPEFVAKTAVYARTEFGMRSISHAVAAELAKHISGKDWAKRFYSRIVHRPDDMLEILAYFRAKNSEKLPNAMKSGFSTAFSKFDSYQLAKYRGEKRDLKLVDLVNLVHPVPSDKNREALAQLIKGELKSTQTWESMISKAGQDVENGAELADNKRKAWKELILSKKIGYFALLRNLRNIAQACYYVPDDNSKINEAVGKIDAAVQEQRDKIQNHELYQFISKKDWLNSKFIKFVDYYEQKIHRLQEQKKNLFENSIEFDFELLDATCNLLENEKLIKKSLILPFRFTTAIGEIDKISNEGKSKILLSLNKALDISCSNIPDFSGKTLVVADFSGSMGSGFKSYKGQACLLGAILAKKNNADFMIFGTEAKYVNLDYNHATYDIINHLQKQNTGNGSIDVGHGTNFNAIFKAANFAYDRLIILSDMQGWIGNYTPVKEFNEYKKRFACSPFIYSLDLAGYGSLQFPEKKIFCLAGFSEKIFDIMQILEHDQNALLHKIENVEI